MAKRRMAVYERDNGICHLCGKPANVHYFDLDHVVPRSRGGTDDESNLCLSHPYCNRSRGNRMGRHIHLWDVQRLKERNAPDYVFKILGSPYIHSTQSDVPDGREHLVEGRITDWQVYLREGAPGAMLCRRSNRASQPSKVRIVLCDTADEAHYFQGLLNSPMALAAETYGLRVPDQLFIPRFDPGSPLHRSLAEQVLRSNITDQGHDACIETVAEIWTLSGEDIRDAREALSRDRNE